VAYRIDPSPAADHETTGGAPPAPYDHEVTVVVVGCGGTGGFLAEAVGRLLLGRTGRLFLVDLDRVEPHNVARQAFLYGISEGGKRPRRGGTRSCVRPGRRDHGCSGSGRRRGRYGMRPKRSASSWTSGGA
jgi:hypothetical protein